MRPTQHLNHQRQTRKAGQVARLDHQRLGRLEMAEARLELFRIHERNPIERMQRRAEALTQRGADLKKVADAWEPLYKTLSAEQKGRMAFVSYVAMRGTRDAVERRIQSDEDDDD